jgi:YNFM family putative membrane transporter
MVWPAWSGTVGVLSLCLHLPMPKPSSNARTAAVVLAGFCAFLTIYAPQPLLPMLGREFHASAATISLVMTATTMGVMLSAPFVGMLADRFGRKRVIVPAAFLLALPATLVATSTGLRSLLIWRVAQGIVMPGIAAVTIAYINEEWENGMGAAMSAYVTGTVFGGFCGRMIAALIASHASWRWSFATLGLLDAVGATAMWAWLPADRHFHRVPSWRSAALQDMARHLRNPRLMATCAVGFCVLFTLLATFTYVNFYLAAPPLRLSTQALGFLFTVYLVGVVVTPWAGRSIDRVGHRLALAGSFAAGIVGILLTLIPRLPAVVLGLAILSTGVFITQAATSSYIGVAARSARASAVGLYSVFYYAGGTLGSALPGWFWNRGGWPACVSLIVVVQAITIAVAMRRWRPELELQPIDQLV